MAWFNRAAADFQLYTLDERSEELKQIRALGSGDRGMLDLLTLDRQGRLVVIELNADEDPQPALAHTRLLDPRTRAQCRSPTTKL